MTLRTRCLNCGTETTIDWGPYVPRSCAFFWQGCEDCGDKELKYCFECGEKENASQTTCV